MESERKRDRYGWIENGVFCEEKRKRWIELITDLLKLSKQDVVAPLLGNGNAISK